MQIMQVKKYIYVINSVPPASSILWWPCIGKPAKFHLEALVWSWDLGFGTTRTLNPHMVFMWFPHGFHVVSKWFAHGLHMACTCPPHGFHVVSTWAPHGFHVVSTWAPHGFHVVSTWFPSYPSNPSHPLHPSIHPRTLIGIWTKQILAGCIWV